MNGGQTLKYNFIIFFAYGEHTLPMLGDVLVNHSQVRVHPYAFDGPSWQQKLFHLHTAYSINKKVNLPFKSVWFSKMYNQGFDNNLPLCFIYLGGNMVRFDGGFTEYVHRKDPRNRVVVLHWDLISKKISYDYEVIRRKVDLAVTYDRSEAEKYGIHYFQETPYSMPIALPKRADIKQDVYFLGAAKDRLDKLYAVYRHLREGGLTCRFLLAGVSEDKRMKGNGLEYITGISYEENIRHLIESKCVLEIVQGGSSDLTLRSKEAIAYQRRLITDCSVDMSQYFHSGQLIQMNYPEDIDTTIVGAELPAEGYPPLLDMNPLKRLYDIQDQLELANESINHQRHYSSL